MPWVRLDDRFASHRKVALLPDRAFRLYISALCWASENLTEGRILDRELTLIARVRGVKAAALELEAAGLWDRVESGWMIHDYLEYNPDKARVQADRTANAARQAAFRERKRAEREAKRAAEEATRNAVTGVTEPRENSTTATRPRHDDDTTATGSRSVNHSSSQVKDFRNGVSNGTPSRPVLPSPMEKEEEETASQHDGLSRIGDRPRIPEASRPLVEKLTAAGMVVGWDLQPGEWFLLEAVIKKSGIDHLVVAAAEMWRKAKERPRQATYFLPGWKALPEIPAGTPVEPVADNLPAVVGGTGNYGRPKPTGEHNADVIAAFRARHQEQQQ